MKNAKILFSIVMLAAIFTMSMPAFAEDGAVILNPGTLSGSVSVTGRDITSITVRSIDTNKEFSATTTVSIPTGASSIDYTLTVEGDNDYYVIVDAYVLTPDTTRALFPVTGPVNVPIGSDVPLNLSMDPAIISGTISTGSSSNTITSYQVYAYVTLPEFDQPPYYCYTYTYGLTSPGDPGRDYTLLVAPGTTYYYVRGYFTIDGLNYYLYDNNVTTPAAGVTLTRDYLIDVTSASVSGTALLQGIDVYYARMYGYANNPTRNTNSTINITTGLYTLAIDQGDWYIRPVFNFYFSDSYPNLSGLRGYLYTPYTPLSGVIAGDELTLDFNIIPGFIPGALNLWGANTNFYSAQVRANEYPSGGLSYSQVDPGTGEFLFVCTPGDWLYDNYQYMRFNYADNQYSTVYQYVYNTANQLTVAAGQTTEPVELTYGTITVQRYFYVAGEGTLSSPKIKATRSEQPVSTAWGYGSSAVTTEGEAMVTLLLPGSYSLEAFATVDGSVTEFGTVDITVEEGDVVVIGGTARPTIKVTNPTNEEIICGNKVTVEGTATDDVGVASITINGENVVFSSTQNPDDPNEVGFSHEITLNIDEENEIIVTVSDEDLTDPISLTMTVFSKICGPDVIECAVDIKPGSCPNPLNVNSNGVLPVAILGTADFDVRTIDPFTIKLKLSQDNLNGGVAAPLRSDFEDVATPYEVDNCECHDLGPDDYMDLTLKFSTQDLVAISLGDSEVGDVVPLILTGNLLESAGGTPIIGQDCVLIVK